MTSFQRAVRKGLETAIDLLLSSLQTLCPLTEFKK
jgi:hypothetical protein